ncbi:alkaline phytoceramidase [Ceraceosorus guamensis]|uniref:Alkaline phytoceramidase n=1 Tax=Ceraceosorus guamensis TaxID=1522189 RepID=A0A316VTZ2_9BASI|nr:alkaline phytoceramidase [Ceraceosorus guamensis]PWN39711.1 alkaline phytoceramidase [Ceraceosorus guamensis]
MAWIDQRPLPRYGYWGPITSSLLWCEEKYVWSRYIAEPVNTFSNLFFIALSLYGARNGYRARLPRRFILVNLGITGIGVGSFFFHMTLQKWAQLLDELPMIYTSALFTYAVCETSPKGRKARFQYGLSATLILAVIAITVGYLYSGNPIFHQAAYAAIQLTSTVRIVTLLRSSSSSINKTLAGRKLKQDINKIFIRGAVTFLTAFGIWQVDNIFCSWLRSTRRLVGQPIALLLEGHAWWHIGTGWGAYAIGVAGALLVSRCECSLRRRGRGRRGRERDGWISFRAPFHRTSRSRRSRRRPATLRWVARGTCRA